MGNYVREVNLELGYPCVDQALRRLSAELDASRHLHAPALKLIHGYGSSGKGGRIRTACRKQLKAELEQGRILDFIPGERFTIFEESTRRAFARCSALRQDPDLEHCNSGVTFVLFK